MSLRISPRRVGAAIALLAMSFGGLHAASASTDRPVRPMTAANPVHTSASELYTGVAPCRLVDTRIVGGPLSGSARSFDVTGNLSSQGGSNTCGIPSYATSIAVNLTGIDETTGRGFVRGWAAGATPPTATLLNYGEEINVSNMVNIPLCRSGNCPDAFTLRNYGANVHVVADVLGYYQTPMWASIGSTANVGDSSGLVSASQPLGGTYNLTFDRPVDSCTATVTDADFITAHVFAVTPIQGQPNGLRVFSKNTSNTLTNAPFMIQLSC